MNHVVENLKAKGLSYDIIASVCGEPYAVIRNASDGKENADVSSSALEKLKRLETVLNSAEENACDIFEKHVITRPDGDKTIWIVVYELWENGIVADDELIDIVNQPDEPFTVVELAEKFGGSADTALDSIENLHHATPADYLGFRKVLV